VDQFGGQQPHHLSADPFQRLPHGRQGGPRGHGGGRVVEPADGDVFRHPSTGPAQRDQCDVLSVVRAVPNGLGLGAFYWEPTWTVVAGNGWDPTNPSSGDGWENQAMWNYSDAALPVIADFAAR